MLKEELYAVLNAHPTLQIDVSKDLIDAIDVEPDEVRKATGRVHTMSLRLLDKKGSFEEMVNFLPQILPEGQK